MKTVKIDSLIIQLGKNENEDSFLFPRQIYKIIQSGSLFNL